MVKILHTAVCANCDEPIEEQDWGQAGRIWYHTRTHRALCSHEKATPAPDTTEGHEVNEA